MTSSLSDVRAKLIAVVRDISFFRSHLGACLARERLPDLIDCVAVDDPERMQFVTYEDCERWGVDPSEVFDAAWSNMPGYFRGGISTETVATYDDGLGGSFQSFQRTSAEFAHCESARLLLPGWLASFRGRVPGTPIAAIPTEDVIRIIGSDVPAPFIAELAQVVLSEYQGAQNSLSPALYTLDAKDQVVPLVLDESSPLAGDVRFGHGVLRAQVCENQRVLLREAVDLDIVLVAKMLVLANEPRGATLAMWHETVPETWLPQSDLVAFISREEGAPPITVPWKALTRMSDLPWDAIEGDTHPRRMRAFGWPTNAVIDELRKQAVVAH